MTRPLPAILALLALILSPFRAPAQSLDQPLVVHLDPAREIPLPANAEALWLFLPGPDAPTPGVTIHANQKIAAIAPSFVGPSIVAGRLLINGRWSSIRPVLIDSLPLTNTLAAGSSITGSLKNKESLPFAFTARERRPIRFEVVANRLGSRLDPVLRVLDAQNRPLAHADDFPLSGRDSRLTFTPPTSGPFTLELTDVANSTGADCFFCLRATEDSRAPKNVDPLQDPAWIHDAAAAHLRAAFPITNSPPATDGAKSAPLVLPSSFTREFSSKPHVFHLIFPADQKIIIAAETRSLGSPCDAGLALFDETGKLLSESVGAAENGPSLTNRFDKPRACRLEVRELSRLAGPSFRYWLTIRQALPGVELSTDLERATFSDSGEAKIKITAKRHSYDGPITLRAHGLPPGVDLVDPVIPEKKNDIELKLKRTDPKAAPFQIRLSGEINPSDSNPHPSPFPVSTQPALKKMFPLLMFPTAAMDGWIALNPST